MSDNAYAGLGAMVAVVAIWSILGLALYVWYLWALSRLFPYIGLPKAHGWIPIYNQWRLIDRGGLPGWTVLLGLIPGLGILVLVMLIIATHRINREHGEGGGMTVLGIFIPQIWAMILTNHLRDRGYAGVPQGGHNSGGWQQPSQLVEYGPDGQVYPLLGTAPAATGTPGPNDAGWAMPAVPQNSYEAPPAAALFDEPNSAPAAAPVAPQPGSWAPPAPPAPPVPPTPPAAQGYEAQGHEAQGREAQPPAAPVHDNPWSLGATIDGNFERLASEELPPRSSSWNGGGDARPFSWPEVQAPVQQSPELFEPAAPQAPVAQTPPPAPVAQTPPPAPAEQTPSSPEQSEDTPVLAEPSVLAQYAPPAPYAPGSAAPSYSDDEIDATVVTGGAVAPIEDEDDLDHTVMVVRKKQWALELPDGTVLELLGDDVVIGRRPSPVGGSTTLLIPDATRTLSKSHARLRRDGEQWSIEDLNSTNGVFVFDSAGEQIEVEPGTQRTASDQLIIGTLEIRLREIS